MTAKPPTTPAPLCECGCGEHVKSANNGVWARWRPGHHNRWPQGKRPYRRDDWQQPELPLDET